MTIVRIATYNIHKGVQGIGPSRRLEIHNLGHAVEQLDADIVCLQEVRKMHRREEQHFAHWPEQSQADFLAPLGYESIYRTNAITQHGEHGNAVLSRWPVVTHQHEDISDHRFEQRGLLHVEVMVHGQAVRLRTLAATLSTPNTASVIRGSTACISVRVSAARSVPMPSALVVKNGTNNRFRTSGVIPWP